jgi:hypothetical protein
MKRGRFSKERIVGILKENGAGRTVSELSREVSEFDALWLEEASMAGWGLAKRNGRGVWKTRTVA